LLYSQLLSRQKQEDLEFKVSLGKVSKTLSQKQNTNKKIGGMAQVADHFPSICKALDSICEKKEKKENFM
jgi:hypothetical protein